MRCPVPILVALATLGTTGCTMVGRGPVPAPARPSGSPASTEVGPAPEHRRYQGIAWIAGDRFAVELDLTGAGRSDVEALLWIDALGLEAAGRGTATLGRLELSLIYGGTCEGTLTVSVTMVDGGRRGEGRLEAADCTGTAGGPLELELRTGAPIAAPGSVR